MGKLEKAIELKAQFETLMSEAKSEMITEYKELKGKIDLIEKQYLKQFGEPISGAKESKVKKASAATKDPKVTGAKRGRKPKEVELVPTDAEPKKRGRKAKAINVEGTPEAVES